MSSNPAQIILDQASKQTKPLKNDDNFQDFFGVLKKVWEISNRYELEGRIKTTNFVLFGPESVGKTTLVERILKFPVGVVKSGIASTRPLVITTVRQDTEEVTVQDDKNKPIQKDKKDVKDWVAEKMNGPISSRKIYIRVAGPNYMDRQFTDLPGYQLNDNNTGAKDKIRALLEKERNKENTVVVCVGDATQSHTASNLVKAIEEIYGKENFKSKAGENFILALNKADAWLQSADATATTVLARVAEYVQNLGLLPILVGGSIGRDQQTLRDLRNLNQAPFEEIVKELGGADARERADLDAFFHKFRADNATGCLQAIRNNFVGFENFLGAIDAVVVDRDLENLSAIAAQLSELVKENGQAIETTKKENEVLKDVKGSTRELTAYLIQLMEGIMGSDDHCDATNILNKKWLREKLGMTASGEEQIFYNTHYNPNREYDLFDQIGLDTFANPDSESLSNWQRAVQETVELMDANPSSDSIRYMHHPLVGGKLYARAMAVWSAMAYNLLLPSLDDLEGIPQLVGTSYELGTGEDDFFKSAKRMAEAYVKRFPPAIQYLCQKMEFILMRIFDVAWLAMLEKPYYARIARALGLETMKEAIKSTFEEAFFKCARLAYNRAFFDIENEVYKLLPYLDKSPAVTAMKFAFQESEQEIAEQKKDYQQKIAASVKEQFNRELTSDNKMLPKGVTGALQEGMGVGIDLLSAFGSVNPLVLAGVVVLKGTINVVVGEIEKRRQKGKKHEPDDEKALGFAITMYTHFVPRFVASVDGRMRADVWACLKNVPLKRSMEEGVLRSWNIESKEKTRQLNEEKIEHLKEKNGKIIEARAEVQSFLRERERMGGKMEKTKTALNHVDKLSTLCGAALGLRSVSPTDSNVSESDDEPETETLDNGGHVIKVDLEERLRQLNN